MKIQNRYEYDPNKDLLGRGGFARVYRANDTLLHRDVALKVFSNTAGHRYSVLDEIRKAIGLEHPNLLRYYDIVLLEGVNNVGETEQTQIGVMELANAGDLKDFARANPGSPLLYKFLKEVLQGLEYLHSKGIIHRDLKAQNILLVKQNGQLTAKISDFGISKDMGSGGQSSSMMVGTVEYMAPEQFAPDKYGIDGKVNSNLDLWSFGIMIHELLTDTTPFGSRDGDATAEQIMTQILSTELPRDIERLPEPYQSAIRKCLVANARERVRKASELIGYFEGTVSTTAPAPDDATRVYPKGGPAASAPQTDAATKVYRRASEPGSSSRADASEVNGDTTDAAGQTESVSSFGSKTAVWAMLGILVVCGVGVWVWKNQGGAANNALAQAPVTLPAPTLALAPAAVPPTPTPAPGPAVVAPPAPTPTPAPVTPPALTPAQIAANAFTEKLKKFDVRITEASCERQAIQQSFHIVVKGTVKGPVHTEVWPTTIWTHPESKDKNGYYWVGEASCGVWRKDQEKKNLNETFCTHNSKDQPNQTSFVLSGTFFNAYGTLKKEGYEPSEVTISLRHKDVDTNPTKRTWAKEIKKSLRCD